MGHQWNLTSKYSITYLGDYCHVHPNFERQHKLRKQTKNTSKMLDMGFTIVALRMNSILNKDK
jgi:hypothetical protein